MSFTLPGRAVGEIFEDQRVAEVYDAAAGRYRWEELDPVVTLPAGYVPEGTPDVAPAVGDDLAAVAAKLQATTEDHQKRLEYNELGMKWAGEWDPASGAFPTAGTTPAGEPNAGLTQAYDFYEVVGTEAVIDGVTFTPGQRLLALVDTPSTTTVAGNWEPIAGISMTLPADYVPNPDLYLPTPDLEPQPNDPLNIAIAANHQATKRLLAERGFRHINEWAATGTADDAPTMQAAVDDLIAEHVAGGGTLTPDSTAGRTGRAAAKLLIEGDINIGSPWTGLVPGITLQGPTRSAARIRGVDASVRSIVPFSGLGTGDFQYGGGIKDIYIESLHAHQSCLVLPAARAIEIGNLSLMGHGAAVSHTGDAVAHDGQRVVADIAARDAVPIQTDDTTLVVLDASADPVVAALYALSDPGATMPMLAVYTRVAGAWELRTQGGMYGIHQLGLAPGGTVGGSSMNYKTGTIYCTNFVVAEMAEDSVSYVTRSTSSGPLRAQSSSIGLFMDGAATQRFAVDPQDCTAGIIGVNNADRNEINAVVEGGSVAIDYYFDTTSGSNQLSGVFNPAKGTNLNDSNQFASADFQSTTNEIATKISGTNRANTTVMTAAQPFELSGGTPDINLSRGDIGQYDWGAQANPVFSLVMDPIREFTKDAVGVSAGGRVPVIPFVVQTNETDPTKEATWPSVITWNTADGNAPSPWPTGLTHILMQVAVDPTAVNPPTDPLDAAYYDDVIQWTATVIGQYGAVADIPVERYIDSDVVPAIDYGDYRRVMDGTTVVLPEPTAEEDGGKVTFIPETDWPTFAGSGAQWDTGAATNLADTVPSAGDGPIELVMTWGGTAATSSWQIHASPATSGGGGGAAYDDTAVAVGEILAKASPGVAQPADVITLDYADVADGAWSEDIPLTAGVANGKIKPTTKILVDADGFPSGFTLAVVSMPSREVVPVTQAMLNGMTGLSFPAIIPVGIKCGAPDTDITVGTGKATYRLPFACEILEVRASLATEGTGTDTVFDVNVNGASILTTPLTIDAGERTSTTAAVPAVIGTSAAADDAEITIDIDTAGAGAQEPMIWLMVRR